MSLEDRVVGFLATQPACVASDWAIANSLYPYFLRPNPANGARVANIRRACYKSERITQLSSGRRWALVSEYE